MISGWIEILDTHTLSLHGLWLQRSLDDFCGKLVRLDKVELIATAWLRRRIVPVRPSLLVLRPFTFFFLLGNGGPACLASVALRRLCVGCVVLCSAV